LVKETKPIESVGLFEISDTTIQILRGDMIKDIKLTKTISLDTTGGNEMIRKIIISVIVFSFLIINVPTQNACAGGAGGEPLLSDSVGWGIVGAMVIVGIYYVYKTPSAKPPEKEHPQEKAEKSVILKAATSTMISPRGELVIASW
jgi:hypothetical protein